MGRRRLTRRPVAHRIPASRERSAGAREVRRRQPSSRVVLNAVALWRLLDQRNISQNELARQVGTSSGYMSDLVSGKRSPSPQMRRRLQQVLRVADFDDLFIIRPVED